MNVGLTRARSSLLVVGNAAALAQDGNWGALVSVCATKVLGGEGSRGWVAGGNDGRMCHWPAALSLSVAPGLPCPAKGLRHGKEGYAPCLGKSA